MIGFSRGEFFFGSRVGSTKAAGRISFFWFSTITWHFRSKITSHLQSTKPDLQKCETPKNESVDALVWRDEQRQKKGNAKHRRKLLQLLNLFWVSDQTEQRQPFQCCSSALRPLGHQSASRTKCPKNDWVYSTHLLLGGWRDDEKLNRRRVEGAEMMRGVVEQ